MDTRFTRATASAVSDNSISILGCDDVRRMTLDPRRPLGEVSSRDRRRTHQYTGPGAVARWTVALAWLVAGAVAVPDAHAEARRDGAGNRASTSGVVAIARSALSGTRVARATRFGRGSP